MNLDSATRIFLAIVIVLVFSMALSMSKVGARFAWALLVVAITAVVLRNEPQMLATLALLRAQFSPAATSDGSSGGTGF